MIFIIFPKDKNPPIDLVVDSGVVPRLIQLISSKNNTLVLECVLSLTNVACGEQKHLDVIIQNDGIRTIMNTIQTGNSASKSQALWAICNVSSHGDYVNVILLQAGIVQVLLSLMCVTSDNLLAIPTFAFTMDNSSNGGETKTADIQAQPSLFIIQRVSWTLCNLLK